jgi:O-antigen polysaccharide polymerase Wzy-like protein
MFIDAPRVERRRRDRQEGMTLILALATIGPLTALWLVRGEIPDFIRYQAGLLWVLCLLPAWVYVRTDPRVRPPIPFLPLVGFAFGLYYALSAVLGAANASDLALDLTRIQLLDPASDYDRPVEMLLYGWLSLLLGYGTSAIISGRRVRPAFNVRVPLGTRHIRTWGYRLLFGGIAAEAARQGLPLPSVFAGLFAFTADLALFGGSLLVILAARRQLDARGRLLLMIGVTLIVLLRIGTGSLHGVLLALTTLLFALSVAGGRLRLRWLLVGLAGAAVIVSLRGVAIEYRRQVWFTESEVPLRQRSALMLRLLDQKIAEVGPQGAVLHGLRTVAGRSANLDLLADVVRQTPRSVPYWGGETYLSLVGLAVPRFLWPGKPVKRLGQDFGHRYSYLHPTDNNTSVNFPFIVEFYANFGEWGVILGMFLVGIIYRTLERFVNNPRQHILTSVAGLVLLVPQVNVEADFSLIFGGLLLNGAALWALLQLIQRSSFREQAHRVPNAQFAPSLVEAHVRRASSAT